MNKIAIMMMLALAGCECNETTDTSSTDEATTSGEGGCGAGGSDEGGTGGAGGAGGAGGNQGTSTNSTTRPPVAGCFAPIGCTDEAGASVTWEALTARCAAVRRASTAVACPDNIDTPPECVIAYTGNGTGYPLSCDGTSFLLTCCSL